MFCLCFSLSKSQYSHSALRHILNFRRCFTISCYNFLYRLKTKTFINCYFLTAKFSFISTLFECFNVNRESIQSFIILINLGDKIWKNWHWKNTDYRVQLSPLTYAKPITTKAEAVEGMSSDEFNIGAHLFSWQIQRRKRNKVLFNVALSINKKNSIRTHKQKEI